MRGSLLCLAALLLAGPIVAPAEAMEFKTTKTESGNLIIIGSGKIDAGDDEKLHRFVASLPADAHITLMVMNSPGGNLLEGVRMASTIRSSDLSSGAVNMCASACFLMFAAGKERLVIDDAQIGVHSASNEGGNESLETQGVTTLMAREAAEYHVPPSIIGKMVTTPPSSMTWLTHEDLALMGAKLVYTDSGTYRPGSPLRPGSAPTVSSNDPPGGDQPAAPPASRPPPSTPAGSPPPGPARPGLVGHIPRS